MPWGGEILVRDATDADAGAWNAFLDASPQASPLARYEWRKVIEASYGVPTHFLVAERSDGIAGLLGTYETKGIFGERTLYSLRCGLVAADADAARALLRDVERRTQLEGWEGVLLTSGWQSVPDLEPDLIRTTVQLGIDRDGERMWRSLKDKTRNMIRRAEREGVEIISGLGHVDALVDHYHENMSRLRLPIHSRTFFHQVVTQLAQHTEILLARHQGKPIASMMLHFGREAACYPFQNAISAYRNVAPIQLLTWAAMKCCAERAIGLLDMGESRKGSSVFQSKVNFGGTPRDVLYYRVRTDDAARSISRVLRHQCRRIVTVGDRWFINCLPQPLRGSFAERRVTRGRLL